MHKKKRITLLQLLFNCSTTTYITKFVVSASMLEKLPPTCIKFGVGVPNGLTFPFKKISVELNTNESIELQGKELSAALQYLPSVG